MPEQPETKSTTQTKRNWIYPAVILLVLTALVPFGYQQYKAYHKHQVLSAGKSQLLGLYLTCKAYWKEKGSDKECNETIASSKEYGYRPNTTGEMEI